MYKYIYGHIYIYTLKQSKNSQAQALFGEYRCVLLTCIMESDAHAFFKAADAQKVVSVLN